MNLEEYLSPTKRRPRTTAMLLWKHAWRLAKTVGRVWEQDDVMAGDKKRDTFFDRLKQTSTLPWVTSRRRKHVDRRDYGHGGHLNMKLPWDDLERDCVVKLVVE